MSSISTRGRQLVVSITIALSMLFMAPAPAADAETDTLSVSLVSVAQDCGGVTATVVNNSSEPALIRTEQWIDDFIYTPTVVTLAPGEVRTLASGRYFKSVLGIQQTTSGNAKIGDVLLPTEWVVPSTCAPMIGGAKLVKWKPKVSYRNGRTWVKITLSADQTRVGITVPNGAAIKYLTNYKGPTAVGTTFRLQTPSVKRGQRVCYMLYSDNADPYIQAVGEQRFGSMKCYRRPKHPRN